MITEIILKIVNDIWPMLVVSIVAFCIVRFFYLKTHKEKFCFYKEALYLISIIYIWLLLEILTKKDMNNLDGINLIPFSEITKYKIGTDMFNYNILGNILIFIPFGYLIGNYIKPRNIIPIAIISLITSLSVELVQLNTGRSFDIDDIILNLVGGLFGYLLFIGLDAITKRLPSGIRKDWFYNLIVLVLILLFGIYVLGYWSVVFK